MKDSRASVMFLSLLHREVARFLKVAVQTIVTPFINSTLYLMIFGVSLGSSIQLHPEVSYLAFLIPGLVMMACLNNAFQNTSSSIISSKFSGDLEDFKVAPVTPIQLQWAFGVAALARGLIVGGITLLIGEIFYYQIHGTLLSIAHPWWLLYFLCVGGLIFANLGISVAFWSRNFDQLSAVTGFVLLPLIYLGGVFYSVDLLPRFWRTVSLYNPLLYMINGVRLGMIGFSDVAVEQAAWVCLVSLILTSALAHWSLRKGSYHRW